MSTRSILSGAALFVFAGLSLLPVGCTSSAPAKADKVCTPGAYVFCRCQDRQEGTKLCNEDAQSFGPCEPCESFDNPEIPIDEGPYPPTDPPDEDGGTKPSAKCGDGVVQDGEDCDDKNTDDTDGCDSKCKLAGATPQKTIACPGLEVHVWGGGHQPTLAGTTVGGGTHETSGQNVCGSAFNNPYPTSGAAGTDRVFKVIPHKKGTMAVSVTDTSYDAYVYASEACVNGDNKPLACSNKIEGNGSESTSFPVDVDKPVYVFVDGAGIGANKGNFRVSFAIQ